MANLKNKSLKKKSLQETALENATVTKGTSKDQTTLKDGIPADLHTKQRPQRPVVGLSIGSTLNMGDYQSLRADVWLTDEVLPNETVEQAYARIFSVCKDTLEQVVDTYK